MWYPDSWFAVLPRHHLLQSCKKFILFYFVLQATCAYSPIHKSVVQQLLLTKYYLWKFDDRGHLWYLLHGHFLDRGDGLSSSNIKVIYKMIPHVILRLCFDGDNWKFDVNNRKGIPQMRKTMKIRVPVWVSGVKVMFKFIMSRGSGVSLKECNVIGNVEVSWGRLCIWLQTKYPGSRRCTLINLLVRVWFYSWCCNCLR